VAPCRRDSTRDTAVSRGPGPRATEPLCKPQSRSPDGLPTCIPGPSADKLLVEPRRGHISSVSCRLNTCTDGSAETADADESIGCMDSRRPGRSVGCRPRPRRQTRGFRPPRWDRCPALRRWGSYSAFGRGAGEGGRALIHSGSYYIPDRPDRKLDNRRAKGSERSDLCRIDDSCNDVGMKVVS
jgi:hypothetical protein